jgi:C4-dicarboxylate-specific signal transduction histidine kinase
MEWIAFAASAVTALLSFLGVYLSNRKQTALMAYRLEQLEKKVDKHNQVIERTYKLEERASVMQTEIDELKKG